MTRPLIGSGTVIGASDVMLSPTVRGESTVQGALEAGVPILLSEQSVFSTTAAPPGAVYATDTRDYIGGFYQLSATTTVGATNNNTEVQVTFFLDDVQVPNPWVDTPGSTGTLFVSTNAPLFLTGGSHKFEVFVARVAGVGSAQAFSAVVWVEKIGELP